MTDPQPTSISNVHDELFQPFFHLKDRLLTYKTFYDAGITQAAMDALDLIEKIRGEDEIITLPSWLFFASRSLVRERLEKSKSISKGQTGSEKKTALRNHNSLIRYVTVQKLKDDATTWDNAYRLASEQLVQTSAHCSPDGIKKSFLELKKALAGDTASLLKYYPLDWKWSELFRENE